ncbi:MAG: hypothetical protein K0S07_119 [Chlamydiales bacterium]|jgi:hypothetical protein|nr:hypothetical protein [Chlamydiales bacterium]
MPRFTIIDSTSEIRLSPEWQEAKKFTSHNLLVNAQGEKVTSTNFGRTYRIIEKRERYFSLLERVERGFLGALAILCSLGLALFSKPIRKLMSKAKETKRFAVLTQKIEVKDAQSLALSNASPCSGHKDQTLARSPFEILLVIAQATKTSAKGKQGGLSPISLILNHPNHSIIDKNAFLAFLLEKDIQGTPRIHTLTEASTLDILRWADKEKVDLNLQKASSAGKTLFTLWAAKGSLGIVEELLSQDPSVIEQAQSQEVSLFVDAVLNKRKELANVLLNAMERHNIQLTEEEIWVNKAFKNDTNFSSAEFNPLDPELKAKLYYVANAFFNDEIVNKLKRLGMEEPPLFLPGLSIFPPDMGYVQSKDAIQNFLRDLRREGNLLTEEEFSQLGVDNYIDKRDAIGRIQGRNFIAKVIEDHHLRSIKVPKKIAVAHKQVEVLTLFVNNLGELIVKEDQLGVYAEKIIPVQRKLSLEEALELMIAIEKTKYRNISKEKLIFTENEIYFINTEFKDFASIAPCFSAMESIKDYLDSKDEPLFLEAYQKRKKLYEKEKLLNQDKENLKAAYKNYRGDLKNGYRHFSKSYECYPFKVPIKLLMQPPHQKIGL